MLQRKFALIKRKLETYSIDDLTDVSLGTPTNGETLVWNGSAFVPGQFQDIIGDEINLTPKTAPAHNEGTLWYDSTQKTYAFYNDEAEFTVHVGEDSVVRCRNTTGSTITKGQAVYISGATGANLPNVTPAQADALATSRVAGVAAHDIENNSNGYIVSQGIVEGLDTSAFSAGNPLFLSTTTPGALTATRPTTGFAVVVAYCTISNVSVGEIKVALGETAQRSDLTSASQNESISGDWTFSGDVTFNTGVVTINTENYNTYGYAEISSAGYAGQWFHNTSASANEGWWGIETTGSGNEVALRLVNDSGPFTYKNVLAWTRSGNALSAITYGNSADNPTHTFYGHAVFEWGQIEIGETAGGTNYAGLWFVNRDNVADTKYWGLDNESGDDIILRLSNDAGSSYKDALKVTKSAASLAITSQTYGNATDAPTHTFYGVGQAIDTAYTADGANYHWELAATDSVASTNEITLRFHDAGYWYKSIRATTNGFKFTEGNTGTTVPITASTANLTIADVSSYAAAPAYYVDAAAGNGIRFWNGQAEYAYYMAPYTDASYGGRIDSTSDYNQYFAMSLGTNRGFQFKEGLTATPYFGINPDGIRSSVPYYYSGNELRPFKATGGTATNQWVRVAKRESSNGRGSSIVRLWTYGGSQTPTMMEILWSTDWTASTQELTIRHAGTNAASYFTQVKATKNGSTAAYLEVYVNGTSVNFRVEVEEIATANSSSTSVAAETSFTAYTDDTSINPVHSGATNISALTFGQSTRQMINLWSSATATPQYGIGVQASGVYVRTAKNFAVHVGGVHNDGELLAGTGGTMAFYVNSTEAVHKTPVYIDGQTNAIFVRTSGGTSLGRVYTDGASWFGLLNSAGSWAFQTGTTGTYISGYNGTTFQQGIAMYDTWLRLNSSGQFTNGIYTGGNLRVDGRIDLSSSSSASPSLLMGTKIIAYNTETFTYDSDTIPQYGLVWYSDSVSGGIEAALSGYYGIGLFTGGSRRVHVESGGTVTTTGGITMNGTVMTAGTAGSLKVTANTKYLEIGSQNSSWAHYLTDATNGHYFGSQVTVNGNLRPYADSTSDLGSSSLYWSTGYIDVLNLQDGSGGGPYTAGFRRLPQVTATTRTLVVADAGKHIYASSTVTVPASVFSAGDAITIVNSSTGNITVTQGTSTTMYLAGTATTGNRTLAQKGVCTVLCVASNTFIVSGQGLS